MNWIGAGIFEKGFAKFTEQLDTDDWLLLSGGDLRGSPLLVRVGRGADDRPTCLGLVIGFDLEGITARQLCNLKLGEILDVIDQRMQIQWPAGMRHASRRKHRRPGRRGIDRAELEEFAIAYGLMRANTIEGKGLATRLAKKRNMAESTVRRWMRIVDSDDELAAIARQQTRSGK
jgi:hypothetical protein